MLKFRRLSREKRNTLDGLFTDPSLLALDHLLNKNRNFNRFSLARSILAFAATFTNINTILPSMVVKAGGSNFQVGLLTAIMIGTPIIGELLFASYLHLKERKKPFLLLGINLRVLALVLVSLILWQTGRYSDSSTIFLIFALMFIFAISGTFAGVSYSDILGKSLLVEERQGFLYGARFSEAPPYLLRHSWPSVYFLCWRIPITINGSSYLPL